MREKRCSEEQTRLAYLALPLARRLELAWDKEVAPVRRVRSGVVGAEAEEGAASCAWLAIKELGRRDVSTQEAVHLLLGFKSFFCSRRFVQLSFDGNLRLRNRRAGATTDGADGDRPVADSEREPAKPEE